MTCVEMDPVSTPDAGGDAADASSMTSPANDQAGNPLDITGGGTFQIDMSEAHDDLGPPTSGPTCGRAGGRDVFFTIKPQADEVYYLDTFGSDFDTVIKVYTRKSCAQVTAQINAKCGNDACGTPQSQWAGTVNGGYDNCVVVDQIDGAQTLGDLVLHVERGQRDGIRILNGLTIGSNTCGATNASVGSCGGGGPDHGFYWAGCPGIDAALTATTCLAATTYDTQLYALGPNAMNLACNDNDAACTATLTGGSTIAAVLSGPHLFWVVVDGANDSTCGAYQVSFTVN